MKRGGEKALKRGMGKRIKNGNIMGEELPLIKKSDSVFGNDLILSTIFNYLSPEELKWCRKVNRKWNAIATGTLLKKDACLLRLDFVKTGSEAYKSKLRSVPNPYQEIKTVLENSQKFPTSNWVIHSPHSLMEELSFNFGFLLKSLTLLTVNDFNYFQNILKLLPNLEKLVIGNINLHKDFSKRLPKLDSAACVGLKNLKILCIVDISRAKWNTDFFRDLLQNCSRLFTIQVADARLVRILLEEGKLGLLKRALIRPCQYSKSVFASIARNSQPFEEINVDCGTIEPDKTFSLNKIFETSRGSLRKLKVFPLVFFGNIVQNQTLPNLEYLTFEESAAAIAEATPALIAPIPAYMPFVFPFFLMMYPARNNDMDIVEDFYNDDNILTQMTQEMVPRLKVIKFESKVFFRNFSEIPSVTTVEISVPWRRSPPLNYTFPNLKILSLKNTQIEVDRFSKFQFWKRLPVGLEFLDLYQDTFDFLQTRFCFDQVFTGGTSAKWFAPSGDRIGLAVSRESSSILCIPSLRSVRIIFDDQKTMRSTTFLNRVKLSNHAYKFAFQFLPRTQLVIAYDKSPDYGVSKELDASFKAMVPFARFEHNKWAGKVKCYASCCVEF